LDLIEERRAEGGKALEERERKEKGEKYRT
jgi:hypothetical protein